MADYRLIVNNKPFGQSYATQGEAEAALVGYSQAAVDFGGSVVRQGNQLIVTWAAPDNLVEIVGIGKRKEINHV